MAKLWRFNIILINKSMDDSLYGVRLQRITVVAFIFAKSRAWFDEYNYHDSLQARHRGNRALVNQSMVMRDNIYVIVS